MGGSKFKKVQNKIKIMKKTESLRKGELRAPTCCVHYTQPITAYPFYLQGIHHEQNKNWRERQPSFMQLGIAYKKRGTEEVLLKRYFNTFVFYLLTTKNPFRLA